MTNPLVSIIMPSYNSERYIKKSIESVLSQDFPSWELCVTDDCSTDSTVDIVKNYVEADSRIRLFCLDENQGAAAARNLSLEHSRGRFIAYLDSDDLWLPSKLSVQLQYMLDCDIAFSCVSYEVIDEDGVSLGKRVAMLDKVDRKGFLTNNLLQTVGIMVDSEKVDKSLLVMPNLRRRQDAATWLQVLKAGYNCYGIGRILCQYRRAQGSLSSNKFKAAKGVWFLYREVEHLSLPFSLYCFFRYAFLAVWKRIYFEKNNNLPG